MNWADWAIVAILTLSSLIGLFRGFIKEAFSLFIWIAAVIAASLFSHRLDDFLVNTITTPSLRALVSFVGIFVAVLLVGAIINFLIGMLIKATGLSGTDRMVGLCFGSVRGLYIVMLLLIYVPSYIPIKKDPWYQESTLIPYLEPYEKIVKNTANDLTHWIFNLVSKSKEVKV